MTDAELRPRSAASPDVEAGGSGDGSSGSSGDGRAVSGSAAAGGGGGRGGSRRGGDSGGDHEEQDGGGRDGDNDGSGEGDRLLYESTESGGELRAELGRSPNESERFAGRALADEGRGVRLLKASEEKGVKSYDADVENEAWEFKELTVPPERQPENAVYQGLRRGKYQNNGEPLWLLYHVHSGQRENLASVNSAVSDAVRRDQDDLIRGVTLVFDDGTTLHRTREQINEGKKF